MKSQIRKPVAEMTHYSEEYKQQAVERWQNSGRSAAKIGAELGIRPALIFRWAKAQREGRLNGVGPRLAPWRWPAQGGWVALNS